MPVMLLDGELRIDLLQGGAGKDSRGEGQPGLPYTGVKGLRGWTE